jgi:hypothetical protein
VTEGHLAAEIESGFVFTTVQEQLQRLLKGDCAEVVQSGIPAGSFHQPGHVKLSKRHAETLQHVATRIDGA